MLAHSSGLTAQARATFTGAGVVQAIRRGQPWALGNVRTYGRAGVVNLATRLSSSVGPRILVTGFAPPTLSAFVDSELAKVPGVQGQHQLMVDSAGGQRDQVPARGVTPEVHVKSRLEPGWVTIDVRDNGIGFEARYSRRIFRLFERLHGRGSYPGTGIGLALCRRIAERHGGTITASSVPGAGLTFTVTMQTQRTEAVSEAPRAQAVQSVSAPTEEPYVAA